MIDATDVAVDTDVTATFTEAIDPATISPSSATLTEGTTPVAAARTLSAGDTTLTIDPDADLAPDTTYTVTLTGAIEDIAGNPLASAPITWDFTTAPDDPPPGGSGAYQSEDGLLVIEAENADQVINRSGHAWESGQAPPGAVGGEVSVVPDEGGSYSTSELGEAPELRFSVEFDQPGDYMVHVRGNPPDTSGDSLHLGLDGVAQVGSDNISGGAFGVWNWFSWTVGGPSAAILEVDTAGPHVVNVWAREDGISIDRIVLQIAGAPPSGSGPAESPRGIIGGADTRPPVVVARDPSPGQTGVLPSAHVTVAFSEPLDPTSIDDASLELRRASTGSQVDADVELSADQRSLKLSPIGELASGEIHEVRLGDGMADLAGNAHTPPQTWTFTTSSPDSLTATDIVESAGLAGTSHTQGENCVFDYDLDGIRDVLLMTHGAAPWVLMRGLGGGGFAPGRTLTTEHDDRHGCATGDFGGLTATGDPTGPDGLPDVYATVGACQGTCTRPYPNELWIQLADGSFVESSAKFAVEDERGRGREPLSLDFDGDGADDLFVGNETGVLYPSPNRLFLNSGGQFQEEQGIAAGDEVGSLCVAAADIDGDGLVDLANCGNSKLQIFLNEAGETPEDATSELGVPAGLGTKDVEFGDFNGDGALDLAMVQVGTLRVRLNRGGAFPREDFRKSLGIGRDAAIGDADGDGRPDIYVVQGNNSEIPDILLLNAGPEPANGGWRFQEASIPQAAEGDGDTAQALPDWEGSGRAAFLVSNGKWTTPGPRQLVFFVNSDD